MFVISILNEGFSLGFTHTHEEFALRKFTEWLEGSS